MGRRAHPNKHIEAAVAYAEESGWKWIAPGKSAHIWGRLFCPYADREGCRVAVNSTPRHPEYHAKKIRRVVSNCSHLESENGGQDDTV